MKVLKFGGSSLANATRISAVMDIVESALENEKVVLVCSAISGCTDALINIASALGEARSAKIESLHSRHSKIIERLFTGAERERVNADISQLFDELESGKFTGPVEAFGELFLTRIVAAKFAEAGVATSWIDSRHLIRTIDSLVDTSESYKLISEQINSLPNTRLFVAPGFVASDEHGHTTTLGRGGSDYSAALYAAALNATSLQIWTDVPGIMTTNPKDVSSAQTISQISYSSALALAANGAKVLYAPTVQPAMDANIAINILNTFAPQHPGTLICDKRSKLASTWIGVTYTDIDNSELSRICLVAENIENRQSAILRISGALSEVGIAPIGEIFGNGDIFYLNLRRIVVKAALAALHAEFFEARSSDMLEVAICGYGAVGKELVRMIESKGERIAARVGKSIKIVGVASSNRYIIDNNGLTKTDIDLKLAEACPNEGSAFVDAVCTRLARKAVFVDCTNDCTLYKSYIKLLRHGLNIVSSNRRSLAIPYTEYAAIKSCARENGAFFRYSTTVGNSLPILESLTSSANCSDEIIAIEAVVSCTMNDILTQKDTTKSFASILRRLQQVGLTEKDPRQDLGGQDVLSKLLILAREAGVPLEKEDVVVESLLDEECFTCGLEDFYAKLENSEPRFFSLNKELAHKGLALRFVASLIKDSSNGIGYRAEIGLKSVEQTSPFYWLDGSENVIVVRSEHSAPLVIKGAGEGEGLAAVGIIKDLLV